MSWGTKPRDQVEGPNEEKFDIAERAGFAAAKISTEMGIVTDNEYPEGSEESKYWRLGYESYKKVK